MNTQISIQNNGTVTFVLSPQFLQSSGLRIGDTIVVEETDEGVVLVPKSKVLRKERLFAAIDGIRAELATHLKSEVENAFAEAISATRP